MAAVFGWSRAERVLAAADSSGSRSNRGPRALSSKHGSMREGDSRSVSATVICRSRKAPNHLNHIGLSHGAALFLPIFAADPGAGAKRSQFSSLEALIGVELADVMQLLAVAVCPDPAASGSSTIGRANLSAADTVTALRQAIAVASISTMILGSKRRVTPSKVLTGLQPASAHTGTEWSPALAMNSSTSVV